MLNADFCTFLEYKISNAFRSSDNEQLKILWCDGVLLPDNSNEYSKKYVNDKRQIIMTAFIGKDGQDRYTLILQFGKNALSKYARDLDIKECMPAIENLEHFYIDILNKQIIIQLK